MRALVLLTLFVALTVILLIDAIKRPYQSFASSYNIPFRFIKPFRRIFAYRPPAFACDRLATVVPGQYGISLHQGHSLNEHKRELVDFDSVGKCSWPEKTNIGALCVATVDAEALASIEKDVGIDRIECFLVDTYME